MNCESCGAPMELQNGRYFFCAHCGSFHFPEAVNDEVRVIGGEQPTAVCPACRDPPHPYDW